MDKPFDKFVVNGKEMNYQEALKEFAKRGGSYSPEDASKMLTETKIIMDKCIALFERDFPYILAKSAKEYGAAPVASVVLSMPINGLGLLLKNVEIFSDSFHANLDEETIKTFRTEINKIVDVFEKRMLERKKNDKGTM